MHPKCQYRLWGAFCKGKIKLAVQSYNWEHHLPRNILSDAIGELTIHKSSKDYPSHIRKVCFWDEKQKRKFTFLTNAMDLSPLQITELYKNRGQIELFFKRLKQHLKIKKFWSNTEMP